MSGKKPIIGLAGGIGAGKSTVAEEFRKIGCAVISADKINHEVLSRPDIIQNINRWWGKKAKIVKPDGQIDCEVLGWIVFDNGNLLKQLTDLLHPLIFQREKELLQTYQKDPEVVAIVLDIPLLFEAGQDKLCDFVVFVRADEALRYERLRQKRGWDAEKIKKIENFQISLDKKAKKSEYTVDNNSGIPTVSSQVKKVLSTILNNKK